MQGEPFPCRLCVDKRLIYWSSKSLEGFRNATPRQYDWPEGEPHMHAYPPELLEVKPMSESEWLTMVTAPELPEEVRSVVLPAPAPTPIEVPKPEPPPIRTLATPPAMPAEKPKFRTVETFD